MKLGFVTTIELAWFGGLDYGVRHMSGDAGFGEFSL